MEHTIENIYKEYYKRVFYFTSKAIRNKEEAEELASDIFVKVHTNLTKYDANKSAINTWIMNIAKNTIIDHWRTKGKSVDALSMSNFVDEEGREILPKYYTNTTGCNPERNMINNELGEHIINAVASLPSIYQRIADLFFIEEKSHDEICKTLNMPLGSVKGNIFRAKELLRNRLTNL